jgi:hypothetical protein
MVIDKIARCSECCKLEFLNREGRCEWCCETSEIIYSTGQVTAATRPVVDTSEAA